LRPEGRWVAKFSLPDDAIVSNGTILMAVQGTLGETEMYCRAEYATGPATMNAYSEHILRVVANSQVCLPGCLYAFIRSETAFRLLRSISSASKLQEPHYAFLPDVPVPIPNAKDQERIHELVVRAYDSRHKAMALESQAVSIVENAIEEAS
ncbi:MAG: hypothetical protein KDB27_17180, partial [Planctomycetales bacterium]|nr:hypothetical protein [Planctomycetales bacterium]